MSPVVVSEAQAYAGSSGSIIPNLTWAWRPNNFGGLL